MVHVGVDLHKRTSQIAVLTEDGELTQHRFENEVKRVTRCVHEPGLVAKESESP